MTEGTAVDKTCLSVTTEPLGAQQHLLPFSGGLKAHSSSKDAMWVGARSGGAAALLKPGVAQARARGRRSQHLQEEKFVFFVCFF